MDTIASYWSSPRKPNTEELIKQLAESVDGEYTHVIVTNSQGKTEHRIVITY